MSDFAFTWRLISPHKTKIMQGISRRKSIFIIKRTLHNAVFFLEYQQLIQFQLSFWKSKINLPSLAKSLDLAPCLYDEFQSKG